MSNFKTANTWENSSAHIHSMGVMGNYYHFVVLPCDPASPTQKALVEDSVHILLFRVCNGLRQCFGLT